MRESTNPVIGQRPSTNGVIGERQLLRSLYIAALLATALPPLIGGSLMGLAGFYPMPELYLIFTSYSAPYVLVVLFLVLSQVRRFYCFISELPQLPTDQAEHKVRLLSRRLPIYFFALVTLYTNIGIFSADISLQSMGYQVNTLKDHLYHQIGIIPVVLITTFPIFFYIFDQLGRYLAPRGIQISAIPLWVKIVLLGTVTPLLIDTLLVGFYFNQTGHFDSKTVLLWFSLFGIAMAGTWIAWRSLKLSIFPLEKFIATQGNLMNISAGPGLTPLSLDEMGVLTGKLARLAEELVSVSTLQKTILDNMAYSVVAVNRDGVVTHVNRAAEKALGYRAEELVGKCIPMNIHVNEEIARKAAALSEELGRHVEPGFETLVVLSKLGWQNEDEWTMVRKDGTTFPARISVTAMRDQSGEISGYLGIAVDITEQRLAQERLQRALTLNKEVINASPIGIAIYDSVGKCIVANNAIAENVGATIEQLLAQNIHHILSWKEYGLYECAVRALATNSRERHEFEITTTFGKHAYIDCAFTPILLGNEQHLLLMLDDISSRKNTEQALLDSEIMLERAQHISRTGHWTLERESMKVTCSKFLMELFGVGQVCNFGQVFALVYQEDKGLVKEGLESALGEAKDWEMEFRVFNARNELIWIHLIAKVVRDREGNVSEATGTIHDITSKKESERTLHESREMFKEAQRMAKLGSWSLTLDNNKLEWSDEIYRLFEIDKETFGATYDAFIELIHPDDREMVNRAYKQSLLTRNPYEIEHRLLMRDGRVKYVREACETLYDEEGNASISRGTIQDVTEQHLASRTIELYANVFRHSAEAILITDRENCIIAVNPAFIDLTGYSIDELYGKNPSILSSGLVSRETYEEMWNSLNEYDYWQGELTDRKKNGTVYPKWASISVSRDDKGNIVNYIASFTDISARKAAEESIFYLAHHDSLTGLYNRFSLEERLGQALAQMRRNDGRLAVLFIDMDRFKFINDTLGHHIGDSLLVEVASRLRKCVRESDIVARLGGDEFVVVLTGIEEAVDAAQVAKKIIATLGTPYKIGDHELHSTPSIGISIMPDDGLTVDELMKCSDTAMYHAKSQGRNNYQFFKLELTSKVFESMLLERELRSAISNGQLQLYYQPKIIATNGCIAGTEALVRWNHPRLGLVMPDKFIPTAEESDLIEHLGKWVLEEACRQLAEWRDAGIATTIAINLSARQLRNKQFTELLHDTIKRYHVSEGEIELEITESAAMTSAEYAIDQMHAMRSFGAALTIDDFGTGYSSLSYLKMFPVQTLKLDRSFVRDIEVDEDDSTICKATIALAHSLGMKVVAEGVETDAQREFLINHGCDFLQGYLFSKPLAADQITRLLQGENELSLVDR